MGVTYLDFIPKTQNRSSEMNHNFRDVETGKALSNMTNDFSMANDTEFYFGSSSIKEDTNNKVQIDASGSIFLRPSATGQVFGINRLERDDNGTPTYFRTHMQRGWGYIEGDGTEALALAVSFPIAFSDDEVTVIIDYAGAKSGVPSDESDLSSSSSIMCSCYGISSSGFTAELINTGNLNAGTYFGFVWQAYGKLT